MDIRAIEDKVISMYYINRKEFINVAEVMIYKYYRSSRFMDIAQELYEVDKVKGIYFMISLVLRFDNDKKFLSSNNIDNAWLNIEDYVEHVLNDISKNCVKCVHNSGICNLQKIIENYSDDYVELMGDILNNSHKVSSKDIMYITYVMMSFIIN